MFCVDMAPCWRPPCHVHAWGSILLARGGGGVIRSLLASGTVSESTAGMSQFCEYDQIYMFVNKVICASNINFSTCFINV